jgi:hypothetical protein
MKQQPRKPNTTIWGLIVLAGLIALGVSHAPRPGSSGVASPTSNPGMDHKAVASAAIAEQMAGGFTDEQRNQYRRGILHLHNNHRKPGNYTIGEVIWDENDREHDANLGTRVVVDAETTQAPTATTDSCASANTYERQASSDLSGSDYRGAYHNAVSGLAKDDDCTNDTDQLVNKAYLLSMKGMAEQHLSEGDSRTDLNQADMLLEECQTKPALYGTSEGASCETQQRYNIRAETNAEMN